MQVKAETTTKSAWTSIPSSSVDFQGVKKKLNLGIKVTTSEKKSEQLGNSVENTATSAEQKTSLSLLGTYSDSDSEDD